MMHHVKNKNNNQLQDPVQFEEYCIHITATLKKKDTQTMLFPTVCIFKFEKRLHYCSLKVSSLVKFENYVD